MFLYLWSPKEKPLSLWISACHIGIFAINVEKDLPKKYITDPWLIGTRGSSVIDFYFPCVVSYKDLMEAMRASHFFWKLPKMSPFDGIKGFLIVNKTQENFCVALSRRVYYLSQIKNLFTSLFFIRVPKLNTHSMGIIGREYWWTYPFVKKFSPYVQTKNFSPGERTNPWRTSKVLNSLRFFSAYCA